MGTGWMVSGGWGSQGRRRTDVPSEPQFSGASLLTLTLGLIITRSLKARGALSGEQWAEVDIHHMAFLKQIF